MRVKMDFWNFPRRGRGLWFGVWLMAALLGCADVLRAATPDEVQNAIDKSVQFLYGKQKGGNWEAKSRQFYSPARNQTGGVTVTAVYALLSAGENPENPQLATAISYLRSNDFTGVYTLGMRCQVLRMLGADDELKALLRSDGARLVKALSPDSGMYNALLDGPTARPDYRLSPYGVQGVWNCAQDGMEVPTSYWTTIDSAWRKRQLSDGSWNYSPKPKQVDFNQLLTMTTGALSALFMAQDQLSAGIGASHKADAGGDEIKNGLSWVGQHINDIFLMESPHYALFGLEEIGAASGRKYFDGKDWYALGADFLVRSQKSDGSWNGTATDTSYGLLFLTRGRAPVGFNKLQYFNTAGDQQIEGNWNQRPRDLANFDQWMSREVELDKLLNWQVVNLDAQVDDLHDAPILYISGDGAISLSDQHKRTLKTFIEQGGMVLFNANGGNRAFTASVKQLAAEMFPDIGEFRELPADHCILKNEQFLASEWKDPPVFLGFSNGVRELMILLPKADASRAWQAQLTSSRETMFELGANLLLYSSGKKNIREKGETYIVEKSPRIKTTRSLKVARIKYDGMWDPEPGGWRRLAAVMHNRDQLDLKVEAVAIGPQISLGDYKIAHLTGSGHIKLSLDEWIQLHAFVQNGGTLIIDAAGGSPTFAEDIRAQLGSAFFEDANQIDNPLRAGHVLYTEIGSKIDEVTYRAYARHVLTEDFKMPRIRGIKVGDRIGVFYSAEDISAGLVGEPVDGIVGYDPESATALMEHMILYAESGGRPTKGNGDAGGGG
jgi:hypothetical protein